MASNCVGDLAVLNDGTLAHGKHLIVFSYSLSVCRGPAVPRRNLQLFFPANSDIINEATQILISAPYGASKMRRESARNERREKNAFVRVCAGNSRVNIIVVARTTKTMKRRMPLFPYFYFRKRDQREKVRIKKGGKGEEGAFFKKNREEEEL